MRFSITTTITIYLLTSLFSTNLAQEDPNVEWPEERCLDHVSVSAGMTIKLMYHNWDSHNVGRWILAILLKEALGYTVEFVDTNDSGTYQLYEQIGTGLVDVDHEAWRETKEEFYGNWVTKLRLVADAGFLGTVGTEGLFVNKQITDNFFMSAFEYYKTYLRDDIFSTVQNLSHYANVGAPRLCEDGTTSLDCSGAYSCNDESFSEWQCQKGIWFSDACCNATTGTTNCVDSDVSRCVELLYPSPTWTTGVMEQMVQNNNLPMGFVYSGSATTHQQLVEQRFQNNHTVLFYYFFPDPWLTSLQNRYGGATNILFPQWTSGCYEEIESTPNGDADCAAPSFFLHKAVSSTLEHRAPNAFNLISQMTLTAEDFDFVFSLVNNGSSVQSAACEWVRDLHENNREEFDAWVTPSQLLFPTLNSLKSVGPIMFASSGILMNAFYFVVFCKNRNSPIVINNNLPLTFAELFGFSMVCVAAISLVAKPTDFSCAMLDWNLALGYSLAFSVLCARTWRVNRLFNNKKLHMQSIKPYVLGQRVFGVTLVTVILLTAQQLTEPLMPHRQIDADDWKTVFLVCEANFSVAQTLLITFLGLVSAYGLMLAVQVANVPPRFNESRQIGLSVYNVVISAGVAALLRTLMLENEGEMLAYALSIVVSFGAVGSVLVLYTHKILTLLGFVQPPKPMLDVSASKHQVAMATSRANTHRPCDDCKALKMKLERFTKEKEESRELTQELLIEEEPAEVQSPPEEVADEEPTTPPV